MQRNAGMMLALVALLVSTSFAQTWLSVEPRITDKTLYSLSFLDSLRGWIAGDSGTLLTTNNGGQNWSLVGTGVADTLFDVKFLDSQNGWIVGSSGLMMKTTDGGKTWQRQLKRTSRGLHAINAFGRDTLWFGADQYPFFMLLSGDGGTTWTTVINDTIDMNDYAFANSHTFMTVGNMGQAMTTSDCGKSWSNVAVTDSFGLYWAAYFLNDSVGWTMFNNSHDVDRLFATGNGGKNWHLATDRMPYNIYRVQDMMFVDSLHGGLIASYGKTQLCVTDDGGATWRLDPNLPSLYENLFKIQADTKKNFWTVGEYGAIYTTKTFGPAGSVLKPISAIMPRVALHLTPTRLVLKNANGVERLTILDMQGRCLVTAKGAEATQKNGIDISRLPAGVYVCRVSGEKVSYGPALFRVQ